MRKKQSHSVHIYIAIGLIGVLVVGGMGVLLVLDKALIRHQVERRTVAGSNSIPIKSTPGINSSLILGGGAQQAKNDSSTSLGRLDLQKLNPAQAREALRSAPAKSIQQAVQAKTGRSVGLDKIEQARSKALTSQGQRKISEAISRRSEIDTTKLRERFLQ